MSKSKKSEALVPDSHEVTLTFQLGASRQDGEVISHHPLIVVLEEFLNSANDLREAVYISIPSISKTHLLEITKLEKELNRYTNAEGEMVPATIESSPHAASKIINIAMEVTRLSKSKATSVLESSLFVGLFSQYDLFIGKLLTGLYLLKPELYRNISREISLSDLLEFDSLESVKTDMLDKEIDSFKRESYIDQFGAMERKFGLPLKKFQEWPVFVELGQRRNLMTHTGGTVSEQYLNVCEREGYKFEKRPQVGERLGLGPAYFDDAIATLSKIAFMLTHTLWRKLAPEEVSISDVFLNKNIYDLLQQKKWSLAVEFGSFGLEQVICRNSNEIDTRMRVVNTAIALTRLGRKKEALKLLDNVDLSASIRELKLADAILRDNVEGAAEIMRSIGKKGELVNQLSYHQWPLFEKICDTTEFQDAYFDIYDVPFVEKMVQSVQNAPELPYPENSAPIPASHHSDILPTTGDTPLGELIPSKPRKRSSIVAKSIPKNGAVQ